MITFKNKETYKTILRIAIPIALQNIVTFSVSLTDTVMLGMLGETALSASAVANQPGFVFMVAVFGMCSGAQVLISQYWGKNEIKPIRSIIGIVLRLSVVLAAIMTVLMLLFPTQLLGLFTDNAEVLDQGVRYLKIIAFTYLFVSIATVYINTCRAVEIVKIAVVVSILSFSINVFLNWTLIFGNLGFPRLGIEGAAIATLCARITEFLVMIVFVMFIEKRIKFRWHNIFKAERYLWADLFKYASPVLLNEFMWSLGIALQTLILGRVSADALAANSICNVVMQFTNVFVWGIVSASAVLIGKSVGIGDYRETMSMVRLLQRLYIIIGVTMCVAMLLLRHFAVDFYNVSDTVKQMALDFIVVSAFIFISVSYNAPCLVGIHRGGGDTRFVLIIDLVFVWLVAIPFGALAAFVFKLPMWAVYIFLKIDEPIKMVISYIRLRGTKWIRNVTRE